MAGNTLTGLIPTIYTALDSVSREQVGFIPAVARNSKAETAALDQNITAPVAPIAKTVDIVPGPTATGKNNWLSGRQAPITCCWLTSSNKPFVPWRTKSIAI